MQIDSDQFDSIVNVGTTVLFTSFVRFPVRKSIIMPYRVVNV